MSSSGLAEKVADLDKLIDEENVLFLDMAHRELEAYVRAHDDIDASEAVWYLKGIIARHRKNDSAIHISPNGEKYIICPKCQMASYSQGDIDNKYCAR